MKVVIFWQKIVLSFLVGLCLSLGTLAQTENPKTRERIPPDEIKTKTENTTNDEIEAKKPAPTPIPTPSENNQNSPQTEEEIILPYYNNYLKEYRLGPNDIISIEVFGQCPDYCKNNITIPPTARISYPLIREGVFVGGKTVEQVADEITKKLDEYIIDPKVTVTLEKAMSVRYSVLGKVASPGVRIMDRKVSLFEAIIESGGVSKDGDKKRITIYRYDAKGNLSSQVVNLQDIERGKAPMVFLNPGDQVFVPDKGFRLSSGKVFDILSKASIVRFLFGSPF